MIVRGSTAGPIVAQNALLLAAGAGFGATAVFGASFTLSVDQFAEYVVGVNIGPILFPLVLWGNAGQLAELSSRPGRATGALRDQLAVELIVGICRRSLLVLAVAVPCLTLVSSSLRSVVLLGLSLSVVQAVSSGLRVLLVAEDKTSMALFGDGVLRSLIVVGIGLPLSVVWPDATVLLVTHTFGGLVAAAFLLRAGRFALRGSRGANQLSASVSWALVSDVTMRSLRRADAVILGMLGFTSSAGVVGVAWRIADVFLLPLTALHTTSVARFSESRRNGQLGWAVFSGRWKPAVQLSVGWGAVFVAAIAFGAPAVEPYADVLQVKNAIAVISLLVGAQFVNGMLGPTVEWMTVAGSFRILAITSGLATAIHLLGVVLLRHDLYAVAAWGALVTAAWSVALLLMVRRAAITP